MVNINNAMMSQLYHQGMAAGAPYFLPPGYPTPPGLGGKGEMGTLPRPPSFDVFYNMDPSRIPQSGPLEGGGLAYRGSFPWVGSSEGIAAAFGSSVSLPFAANEWPSMTNLINSGESMENIAQLLTQYQTPGNTEGTPGATSETNRSASTEKDSKDSDREKSRVSEDVGLSLDDPTPASASKSYGFNGSWKPPVGKTVEPEKSSDKTSISRSSTNTTYSIPTDSMAVMAPMYSRQSTESKSSSGTSFPTKVKYWIYFMLAFI